MTRCVGRDEGEGLWHARNQSDKHMLPHHIMVRNARQADRQKRTNFADCLLIWHIGRKHSISISERLFFLAATLDRKEARWFLRHLRGEQQSFSRSDSYVGVRWSLSPAASNTHSDFFFISLRAYFLGQCSNFGGWLVSIYLRCDFCHQYNLIPCCWSEIVSRNQSRGTPACPCPETAHFYRIPTLYHVTVS